MQKTSPNGVTVTFPDGTDQSTIDQVLAHVDSQGGGSNKPSPAAEPTAEGGFMAAFGDVAKGVGSGILRAGEGIASTPSALKHGMEWLADQTGEALFGPLSAEKKRKLEANRTDILPFGLEDTIAKGATAALDAVGAQYKPKTRAGQYAQTISEFTAGAAMPGGEGSMLRRMILYGVLPGTASETAGQLTKGTPYEKAARIVAGLAAGATPAAFDHAGAVAAMTVDEIEAQAHQLYDAVTQSGFQIRPRSFQDALVRAGRDLYSEGLRPRNHPTVWRNFQEIVRTTDRFAASGTPLTLMEVDRLRRLLKAPLADFNNPDGQRLAGILRNHIDDWFDNLSARDVLNQRNPQAAVEQLQTARRFWHTVRKQNILDDVMRRAQLAASASYTMAGRQTALKQQFKNLVNNKKLFRVFAPDEQAAIENVVRQGAAEWLTRMVGKLAIRSQMNVIGATLNAATFGGLGKVASLIGEASKHASTAITAEKADYVSELVRQGAGGGNFAPRGRGFVNPSFYGGQAAGGALDPFLPGAALSGGPAPLANGTTPAAPLAAPAPAASAAPGGMPGPISGVGPGGATFRWHGLLYQQTPDGKVTLVPGQTLQ